MMNSTEFLETVRMRAGLPSKAAAERLVASTLDSLTPRLNEPVRGIIADALPADLGAPLRKRADRRTYPVREFYRRLSRRLGESDTEFARRGSRAVLSVIRDHLPVETFDLLLDELPQDYVNLVDWQATAA
jgi:uncharacterized protein (DUF2267 family)